ncbi:hypothetical protein FB561_7441 [Kribbella amoyensis]|uniref:Uncharacterized protein n=1 Tax=Kribbella amoyensis TaxID=996641 RepID=A0A561B0Q0_9ACTN|nr:hypothetical protein [Kribbella amoyensis]TWD72449.1 hypothetical protein FB561_7441 [Kribbella amoyensis]
MDIVQFNSLYSDARLRQRRDPGVDVTTVQAELRELIADETDAEERSWALRMIERLAEPLPIAPERSALYEEAGRVSAAAYPIEGSVDEQIAALEEARRRIWAIADRASDDEGPDIRAMTRSLEHIERALRNPNWPSEQH